MQSIEFRAAVMREARQPLAVESVSGGPVKDTDILAKVGRTEHCNAGAEDPVDAEVSLQMGIFDGRTADRALELRRRPAQDGFPKLARAYLDGALMLDDMITRRIGAR